MLRDSFIERLREDCDIVSLVKSDGVALKRKGRSYWGCCPFHGEKTPSFVVHQDKQLFYCFGCHIGGDVFNFFMKRYNFSFREAVNFIAEKIGILVPEEEVNIIKNKNPKQESLLRVLGKAKEFFYACLHKSVYGKEPLQYLMRRGINKKILENFEVGFAPDLKGRLALEMQKKDFTLDELQEASLIILENEQNDVKDRFRGRIIFPIKDIKGKVIAFGGRTIKERGKPKYLNSGESIVFNKRKNLFGLYEAKEAIYKTQEVVLVEGYMDVLAMHNFGFLNTVASMGTALTAEQVKIIKKMATKVILAFDHDIAGEKALLVAGDLLSSSDLDVKVLGFNEAKDPDEFLQKFGIQAMNELLKKALPFIEYKIDKILSSYDLEKADSKGKALNKVVATLTENVDSVTADVYLRRLAERFSVSYFVLNREYERLKEKKTVIEKDSYTDEQKFDEAIARKMDSDAVILSERKLLESMLKDVSLANYVLLQLNKEDFSSVRKSLFERYFLQGDLEQNINFLRGALAKAEAGGLAPEELEELYRIVVSDYTFYFSGFDLVNETEECIRKIKINSLRKQIEKIGAKVTLLKETDHEYIIEQERLKDVHEKLKKLLS